MLTYSMILTLNGNYILKEDSKVKATDDVEMEFYGVSIEDIKAQFKAHKKELQGGN